MLFMLFKYFNICILTLLLPICDIISHYCIFLSSISIKITKKTATWRTDRRLYIFVPNYSAVVGLYMVTCLTARNVDNLNIHTIFSLVSEDKISYSCCASFAWKQVNWYENYFATESGSLLRPISVG